MEVRDMEDMLVSLFDPALTTSEKVRLLEDHPVKFSWCLSDVDGPVVIDGIEVIFKSGDAYRFVIISGGE
ncbi:MAG: hypothetical protein JEY79_12825 [Pseudodesulfovibrio sp.]|nr:hypothetical protein [Pseudodesulfovibrio sp.]